jgi:hypothetical protein
MCCCLAWADRDLEVNPSAESGAHTCCQMADEESANQVDPPADHDCPHEDIKQSQINDATSDLQQGHSNPLNQSSDYFEAALAFETLSPALYSPAKALTTFAHSPPGSSLSREYCVYLL